MNNTQNIDKCIVIDVAERIERLINYAQTNIAWSINITEVFTKYNWKNHHKCCTRV